MGKVHKKNDYHSDDDNIRYKINTSFIANNLSPRVKKAKDIDEDNNIRYKFPTTQTKSKPENKVKTKPKIKVNFWSNKQSNRIQNSDKRKTSRRHTFGGTSQATESRPKPGVKVRKQVSFLPTPVFSENHVPMVTVPDELTIQLNEEEANVLGADLNQAFVHSLNDTDKTNKSKREAKVLISKHVNISEKSQRNCDIGPQGNENDLEYFSKYIEQKLRKMETNQRIYSENLINTVLMLGQLGKLSGKSKIGAA